MTLTHFKPKSEELGFSFQTDLFKTSRPMSWQTSLFTFSPTEKEIRIELSAVQTTTTFVPRCQISFIFCRRSYIFISLFSSPLFFKAHPEYLFLLSYFFIIFVPAKTSRKKDKQWIKVALLRRRHCGMHFRGDLSPLWFGKRFWESSEIMKVHSFGPDEMQNQGPTWKVKEFEPEMAIRPYQMQCRWTSMKPRLLLVK